MATMDLSTSQEVMGMQSRYEYAHHLFNEKETFEETDIQGNINLFNTLKTEANSKHDHDSSSLLQVKCLDENKFEVDNDLFSFSNFKKAMDLRIHNRTLDGVRRTIFDDAEYFAKNYRYKLLPITLEPVDETVIQTEHNYSLMSVNSESEPEENFSRTMDYSQVKEKNYKRRRTKFGEDADEEPVEHDSFDTPHNGFHSSPMLHEEILTAEEEQQNSSLDLEIDDEVAVQPLDLSAAPLVQKEKTDSHLRESPSSIVENEEVAQLDSDKENVNSDLSGILVTITRPDEKENYQPCDLFLNDIARLVPKLIDKDCLEVDILDRTCDRHDEFRKHRLYYVISESTWRLFQRTNERVILTNDQSLGQPIRKADEEEERPSYLVFDQFSLAKCLADYCQEIGGCFEYTCVEEDKQETCGKEGEGERLENVPEAEKETDERVEEKTVDVLEKEPEEEKTEEVSQETKDVTDAVEKSPEEMPEEIKETRQDATDVSQEEPAQTEEEKTGETAVPPPEPEENAPEKADETKQKPPDQEKETEKPEQSTPEKAVIQTKTKKKSRGTKRTRKSSIQRKPKTSRTTPKVHSTPESETSQKSDKPVSRKGKREQTAGKEEPPKKVSKPSAPEEPYRKTRSGKVLQEVKTNKPTPRKKKEAGPKEKNKTESEGTGQKGTRNDDVKTEETGRRLRSHVTTQWKKVQVWPKSKGKKR